MFWWARRDISSWDTFLVVVFIILISWYLGQFFKLLKSKEDNGAWCGMYLVGTVVWVCILLDHLATAASVK